MDANQPPVGTSEKKPCGVKFLIFLSVIFLLIGAAFIALGAYANYQTWIQLAGKGVSIAMIVFGSFVFVVAFLGCCGAIKHSKCLLSLYIIIVILLFLGLIGIMVAAWYYRANAKDFMGKTWEAMQASNKEDIEKQLKCCGLWTLEANCNATYTVTCGEKAETLIKDNYAVVGGVSIGLLFIQLLGLILAFCTVCTKKPQFNDLNFN